MTMTPWQDIWALVTGASAGIGRELSIQLAAGGASLVLTARRTDRLSTLASELAARYNVQTRVFTADLTQQDAPEALLQFIQSEQIPIEVLINNAGFGIYGKFHQNDCRRLMEMLQVNVHA